MSQVPLRLELLCNCNLPPQSPACVRKLRDLHRQDLDQLNSFFDKLAALRQNIDEQNITSEESIDRF